MFRPVNKVKCLNKRRCYVLADVIAIFVYEVPCIFWRYINVDEVSLITLKKLLQSAMELLQIATGITKCDHYSRTPLFRTRLIRSPRYFEGRSNSPGCTLPLYASPVISKPRYFELFSISLGTSK